MSGYMGFGMQSWIYKKSPRKPFSKRESLPSFSPLPNYSRKFKLKPSVNENKDLNNFLTLVIILVFAIFLFFLVNRFVAYSNNQAISITAINESKDNEAFDFLMKSGKSRLLSNNIFGAYSEFNLAYNIKPKDKELNELMIETLGILCVSEEKYCDRLDVILNTD